MDDSEIICDVVIESYEKENFGNVQNQNFYILLAFLLISITLLILLFDKILSKTKTFITISLFKYEIKGNYVLKI